MARVIAISTKEPEKWEDSPVMQKLIEMDKERFKRAIEKYNNNQKPAGKKKAS